MGVCVCVLATLVMKFCNTCKNKELFLLVGAVLNVELGADNVKFTGTPIRDLILGQFHGFGGCSQLPWRHKAG